LVLKEKIVFSLKNGKIGKNDTDFKGSFLEKYDWGQYVRVGQKALNELVSM